MKRTPSKAYLHTIEFQRKLRQRAKKKPMKKSSIEENSISNTSIGENEDFIPSKFTVVDQNIFSGLNNKEITLVIKIIEELKLYNALWKYDTRKKPRDSKAISGLREKGILEKTETVGIHYVNPYRIRRGKPENVISAMIDLLRDVTRVTDDHIKNLRLKDLTLIEPDEF